MLALTREQRRISLPTAYSGGTVKLVLFDYASPEMARIHTVDFKLVPGAQVKRSGVLVAVDPSRALASAGAMPFWTR